MEKRTRESLREVVRPLFIVLGFFYKALFGWLDILSQRRADASLLYDVQKDLYFLFPVGSVVKGRWYRVLPFDYASVGINYQNVCFWFARGRSELNVSVAPREVPRETYEINVVISALDSTDAAKFRSTQSLPLVADLLRPRLEEITAAFSESQYAEFRKKLPSKSKSLRDLKAEAEWERKKKRSW